MNFRLIEYMLRNRKVILAVTLVFAVAAILYIVFSDAQYKSKTLLMPPLEEGSEGLLSAWAAQMNLPSMVVPMTAGSTKSAILVDILNSRRLGEMIVNSVGLMSWYKADGMEDALRNLKGKTAISTSVASGVITLSVEDRDPAKARDIVQAYVTGLDSLSHMLQLTKAESMMEFLSAQIDKYEARVAESRKKLSDFQTSHGIFDFDEQTRGAVDVASNLKVTEVLASIDVDMARAFSREDALDLKRKEMQYRNLNRELSKLMTGDSTSTVFLPMADMPELFRQYTELKRDVDVNEKVLSYLLQRFEDAKLNKARTTPTVQVVDLPSLPEKRAGLAPWLIVVIVAAAGFIWGCLMVGWWGWVSLRSRDGEEEKAFRSVMDIVDRDISSVRKRLKL